MSWVRSGCPNGSITLFLPALVPAMCSIAPVCGLMRLRPPPPPPPACPVDPLFPAFPIALLFPVPPPDGPKKISVYVKNDKGNVVKVNFGDPNMEIKRDNPSRRKNFRARHSCDNPGPKWKARYWSCKMWR